MKALMVCMIFIFMLSGCLSVSNSPTPKFYMLHSVDKDNISRKFNMASDVIIEVGPVKIPEYLDRPQIVTRDENRMLTFAEFDRWGESLDCGLERLLTENLSAMLVGASLQPFPSNFAIPLKYQVIVDVIQLESRLDKDLLLVVQWSIIDAQKRKMAFTKKSEFRQPINPHNYSGLSDALSMACVSLSSEIAENLASLANQPVAEDKTKE